MDDRRRTLAAITVIIGLFVLIAIVVGVLVSNKQVVSPVPEDDAIKIIFVSPTPIPAITDTVTVTPSVKASPTKKP